MTRCPFFKYSRYEGYEVSTKGDVRFSALVARLPSGRTIEEVYQCDIKGYDKGGTNWRLGKGKPPLTFMAPGELYNAYYGLWKAWCDANPDLVEELYHRACDCGCVLRDRFASSPINQARALAQYLSEHYRVALHDKDYL